MDPYALHADGTAVDPRAFREAALKDPSITEDLSGDERAASVLRSGDDAALQELLKEVHQASEEGATEATTSRGTEKKRGGRGGRENARDGK